MFQDIESFARHLFVALFLIACTILAVRISFGFKNNNAREAGIVGFLILLIGVQYYYLLSVATYLPSNQFYVYDNSLTRLDCLQSSKGTFLYFIFYFVRSLNKSLHISRW
jgi:hypothetical protein